MIDYVYNNRRQLALERVTTLGGATDGHVRSIEREHDDLGRMFRVTSHGHYAGNRTYRQNALTTLKDQLFGYDGLHRLKNSKQGTLDFMGMSPAIDGTPTTEQDWTLDTLGNWSGFITKAGGTTNLNQTRTTNKVNEITNITNSVGMGWVTPEYDPAGNATKLPYPAIPTQLTTQIYDAWNRLVEVKFGTTITLERYEYDGLGRRIVRTIFPSTTNDVLHSYYNENWQELEVRREISGTESAYPLEQFVWHPYYIDALATRFYDSDVSDSGGVVQHYFTHDANFNITAALDSSGNVTERYDYSPYGKATFLDASFAPLMTQASTIANSYLYTGRRLDSTTGLYQYRHRYYYAEMGIFTTQDPIGYDSGDENLYRYVFSNPTNGMDPDGLACEINYKCELMNIRPDPSNCSGYCQYKCTEDVSQGRKTRLGIAPGALPIDCGHESLKGKHVTYTSDIVPRDRDGGFKCPQETTLRVTWGGIAEREDCSISDCQKKCSDNASTVSTACDLFRDRKLRLACEAANVAGKEACKAYCKLRCNQP